MNQDQLPRVVIIGGGFGGVFSARQLHKKLKGKAEIELISNRNYFVFQPLLPEVAGGTIHAQDAVTPIRTLLKGIQVRQAEVRKIDFATSALQVVQGKRRIPVEIRYDHLVIASGQITEMSIFPGFEEHSLTMKDLADAHRLRNHIIKCLELADITRSAERKQAALCFVVAGGGFSGVETIGEMQDLLRRIIGNYPNISRAEVRLILIQRGPRILPELPAKLSSYAEKKLKKRGVEILLETGIHSATLNTVRTDQGEVISTHTVVTTIGNGPSPFLRSLDLPMTRGRIDVTAQLRVQGHERTWALGDCANVPLGEGLAPPTAQFATREAGVLANNIACAVLGQGSPRHLEYTSKGMLASLGGYSGVAQILGINISGIIAWGLWRGFYIAMLPGLSTRIRVALNWFFDYFMPRTIVQIQQGKKPGCYFVHYAKGDVIFEREQLLDGFHIVTKGQLEMRIPQTGEQDLVKTFGPGDHWGERLIEFDVAITGRVTALEDSIVMVMERNDFKRLRSSFQPINDYFSTIDESHYSAGVRKDQKILTSHEQA